MAGGQRWSDFGHCLLACWSAANYCPVVCQWSVISPLSATGWYGSGEQWPKTGSHLLAEHVSCRVKTGYLPTIGQFHIGKALTSLFHITSFLICARIAFKVNKRNFANKETILLVPSKLRAELMHTCHDEPSAVRYRVSRTFACIRED